jgi:hypothetical protein
LSLNYSKNANAKRPRTHDARALSLVAELNTEEVVAAPEPALEDDEEEVACPVVDGALEDVLSPREEVVSITGDVDSAPGEAEEVDPAPVEAEEVDSAPGDAAEVDSVTTATVVVSGTEVVEVAEVALGVL